MIRFLMDEASVKATSDHLEATRQNILTGIREAMMEGMQGLAQSIGEKLQGSPIAERTGDLLNAVLSSPRVVETPAYIAGSVSTTTAKFRNLGLWLEFGTRYPQRATGNYPKQFAMGSFVAANRSSINSLGHGAFRIEPKPFFNPTFEEYYPTILELINQRIAEACNA